MLPYNYCFRFPLRDITTAGFSGILDRPYVESPSFSEQLGIFREVEALAESSSPRALDAMIASAFMSVLYRMGHPVTQGALVTFRAGKDKTSAGQWTLGLPRITNDGKEPIPLIPLMRILPTTEGKIHWEPKGSYDFHGELLEEEVDTVLRGYLTATDPSNRESSLFAVPSVLMTAILSAGYHVEAYATPKDTSRGHASFFLSNGLDHVIIDLFGPVLASFQSALEDFLKASEPAPANPSN